MFPGHVSALQKMGVEALSRRTTRTPDPPLPGAKASYLETTVSRGLLLLL